MKKKPEPKISPLCAAIKKVREAYGDSQERFAQRVSLSAMSVSRFELGKRVPRDPGTLQKLFDAAAGHGGVKAEAKLLSDAWKDGRVNQGLLGRHTPFSEQMIPFQSMAEWRLMNAARIAARYYYDEAIAIQNAAPQAMEIIDTVLADADAGEGIDEAFYDDLEERLTELAEQRTLERLQQKRKQQR